MLYLSLSVLIFVLQILFSQKNVPASPVNPLSSENYTLQAEEDTEMNVPERLLIPSINLSYPVVGVSTEENGRMAVPEGYNIGWYLGGTVPGQPGTAVLDGHYKFESGKPGVFYKLKELKIGDQLFIETKDGKQLSFSVVDRQIYSLNSFPSEKIFASGDEAKINIITCTGKYDSKIDDYQERLVITALLEL